MSDPDFERTIRYRVEYEEVIRRTCEVEVTYEFDIAHPSTAAAILATVEDGETDEDYEIDSGVQLVSWKEIE